MMRTRALASLAAAGVGRHLDRHPRQRPFTAIVDEIADHLLEILLLAAKSRMLRHVDVDGDIAGVMELLHGAGERGDDRRHVDQCADHGRARGEPRPFELAGHLIAHDVGLLQYLMRQRIVAARRRLVDE